MMKWIIESKYEGMILRNYLHRVLRISKNILKAVKYEGGKILINGQKVDVRYRLKKHDELVIKFPPEKRGFYMEPEEIPLSIVYEDDHILVLNKQAGIVAMPTPHTPKGTIANGILAYYDKLGLPYTVHIVTRLDRDTSGLMLIAKHRYSHSLLSEIQQAGGIERSYIAFVHGHLKEKRGTIHLPIGRKADSFMEREVRRDGREAITHYEVRDEKEHYSKIKVQLETGRTHQIRVHLSAIGHPLLGDNLYGGKDNFIDRQALHCYELSFKHPLKEKVIHLKSELPLDLRNLK